MNRGALATAFLGALIGACMLALGAAALLGRAPTIVHSWSLPAFGTPHFAATPLSGFFVLIAGTIAVPSSIYSLAYLRRYRGEYSLDVFAAVYVLLLLSVVAIFFAADVVSFTVAWEIMTLTSCGLIAFEWRDRRAARAALLTLAMSEFGTLAVVLAFLLAARPAGSLDFTAIAAHASALSPIARVFIVLLSLFGFGVKAGVLPFNAWLPRAYPAAPANATAIIAGVLVNCGLYGMLLLNLVLVPQNAMLFGALALVVGALSAVVGILYATIDDDLKRMLAFSSVENLGIALTAIGAGAIFLALHRFDLAALGIGAGLWHMANHSLYKALLFLGAGAVDTVAGSTRMNLLGGLARAAPVTATCFLVAAVAIAGIPPLNGFASEWLTLETLLRSAEVGLVPVKIAFVLAGALIALTAALAVTCFVKAYAMTFLGTPRSESARNVRRELPAAAGIGMGLLAGACVVAGIFPAYAIQLVDAALPGTLHGQLAAALLPPFLEYGHGSGGFMRDFHALGATIGAGIIPGRSLVVLHRGGVTNPVVFAMSSTYLAVFSAAILGGAFVVVRLLTRRPAVRGRIWAGGLRSPSPDMTYTATGFSNPVRVIFEAVFNPRTIENTREAIHDHFRVAVTRRRERDYVGDRLATEPLVAKVRDYANDLARMHHGRLEGYVTYALLALVVVMLAVVFLA